MRKSFASLGLPITEAEYREDGNLHYSTLATYERGGFGAIETLGEKKESPSLLFGSLVDCMMTGSQKEFDSLYLVAEFPVLPPAYEKVTKALFDAYKHTYNSLLKIPDSDILRVAENAGFYSTWKPESRVKAIREKCCEYYNLLIIAEGKTLVDTATYEDACAAVRALKESPATKWYFEKDNPFDDSIEHVYQPKFKATIDGLTYSCMADLVVIDHKNKIIYPCDLKTSSHTEYDFYKSFLDWSY